RSRAELPVKPRTKFPSFATRTSFRHPMRRLSLAFLIFGLVAGLRAADDFTLIDSLDALRVYAAKDNVKVRLLPGTYTLDHATSAHFLRFTGRDSHFDFRGVTLRIDTKLFRRFGDPGADGFYCVIDLAGDGIVFEGLTTENF